MHRQVRVEASKLHPERPSTTAPLSERGLPRSKHLDQLHRFTEVHLSVSALLPEGSAPPGWQEYSSGCQEKTLWGRLAHSISPTQVGMEMEQGAHRQNRVGALSPNPSIPGVLLLSAVPENLKQRSKRAGET